MKITAVIYLGLMLFFSVGSEAQEHLDSDSLSAELSRAEDDTNKVRLLISLGQQFEGTRPDTSIMYYEEALGLSRKLGYTRGVISYFTNVTYVYNLLGRYDTSLVLNLQGLEIAKAYGAMDRVIACINNVATSYYYLEDYEQAMAYYLQALDLVKKSHDESRISMLYTNLSNIYHDTREYGTAISYADSSVTLARAAKDSFGLLYALNAKSSALISSGRYTDAKNVLTEGIALSRVVNDNYTLNAFLLNLAGLHLKTGEAEAAEPLYSEALKLARAIDDRKGITISYRGLGYYYLNRKDFRQADYYTRKSIEFARKGNFMAELQKGYLLLSDLALASGRMKDYNNLRMVSDSIETAVMNDDIIKSIHNLEIKYSAEQKEQEIESLSHKTELQKLTIRKKQLLLLSLAGILFTVALSFIFVWFGSRQKRRILEQEKEIRERRIAELEIEKQLVASEAILKGQEEERTRLARDLHDGLGGMLSGIRFSFSQVKENLVMTPENQSAFDRSLEMLGSSIQELRHIAHNMMPESLLKFGLDTALRDFCTEFNKSGTISVTYQSYDLENMVAGQTTLVTVYRIVQELLNNARKHASASEAFVQLVFSDNTLTVTVEDNGRGFDTDLLLRANGIGWKNIRSRIEYLGGSWDIQSEPGKGTAVNIVIGSGGHENPRVINGNVKDVG
jgi:signal transduction histidine kinase